MAARIESHAEGIVRNETYHAGVSAVRIEHRDITAEMTDKSAIFSSDHKSWLWERQCRAEQMQGGCVEDADGAIIGVDNIESPRRYIRTPRTKPNTKLLDLLAAGEINHTNCVALLVNDVRQTISIS
jgi:hypothetical protein